MDRYFDAMREFLATQERAMKAYLQGSPLPPPPSRECAPVWITGIGMVTPLGIDAAQTWEAMCRGTPGIHAVRSFDPAGLATVRALAAGEYPDGPAARVAPAAPAGSATGAAGITTTPPPATV